MSATLLHSPAAITRAVLIAIGEASEPDTHQPWPAFVAQEPALPDNCITVYDTTGKNHGRAMPTGDRFEDHGVQGRVRSAGGIGRVKCQRLAVLLAAVSLREVAVDGTRYVVDSLTRAGPVLSLGPELSAGGRYLFTANFFIAIGE